MASTEEKAYSYLLKILLVGDTGVGKTATIRRFSENSWTDSYIASLGVDFKISNLQLGKHKVKLQIWDTAGQERFRTITTSYYRGAHGIMVMYDLTDNSSFANVKKWLQEVDRYASDDVQKIVVGNKADLAAASRAVATADGADYCEQLGVPFVEASAKTGENVRDAFSALARLILVAKHDVDEDELADPDADEASAAGAAAAAAGGTGSAKKDEKPV